MRLSMSSTLSWALALSFALGALTARAGEAMVLPLVLHIVDDGSGPVVSDGFTSEQVARANEIFAPHGVQFVVTSEVVRAGRHAALEDKADRDALGAYAERGAIDCFFVRSLRDVDDPSVMRRGVHWWSRTHTGKHYVIVSSVAGPNVLAHELGHYLGHPGHSEVAGNLMSYIAAEGLPVLEPKQVARMQRAARRYVQTGELKQRR